LADDNIPSQKYRDTGIPRYFMTSSIVNNFRKNPRVQIICSALTDSLCHMLMILCVNFLPLDVIFMLLAFMLEF